MLKTDALRAVLFAGSMLVIPAELTKRFEELLGQLTKGKHKSKVWIGLE